MENSKKVIEISYGSIIRVAVVFFGLAFLFYLKDIIFILFVSMLLALIIDPAVDKLERMKIPRVIGTFSLFVLFFAFLAFMFYLAVPPLIKEINQLTHITTHYLNENTFFVNQQILRNELSGPLQDVLIETGKYLKSVTSSVLSGVFKLLGGVISAILILVISFYLIIEEKGIERFVKEIVPSNSQLRALRIVKKIQIKLGRWFIGQLSLAFIIGIMSFIGLTLLGVPYAFVLAVIAGVLELVPYIGPVLSSIPAILIAFSISPALALFTLALYFLIQQFENYVIVPKVMERSVNLHPIVIIVVVIIGGKLDGIAGAILAVPVATIASIIIEDINENKKLKDKNKGH